MTGTHWSNRCPDCRVISQCRCPSDSKPEHSMPCAEADAAACQDRGRYWCNSHKRHTTDAARCVIRREGALQPRGGILLPCDVERDFGRL